MKERSGGDQEQVWWTEQKSEFAFEVAHLWQGAIEPAVTKAFHPWSRIYADEGVDEVNLFTVN